MTREELINLIKFRKGDIPFLLLIFKTVLKLLPKNTVYGIAHDLYLRHIYEGKIVRCISTKNRSVLYFAGITKTYEYIVKMYPKADKKAISNCVAGRRKEAYDHTFQYITKEEL